MPRGGDKRRIIRSEGRDLSYASLIMQAMCEDTSEVGGKFNEERQALFLRWERLVRALVHHKVPGWANPPSSLDKIKGYIELAAVARLVSYPRSSSSTDQKSDLQCGIVDPQGHSYAKPGRKSRISKRGMVRRYWEEASDFCSRWRLQTWWAVPGIVSSHFFRVETGYDGVLDSYISPSWDVETYPVVGNVTGSTGVAVDWDGRTKYPSRYDNTNLVTASAHVVEQCEAYIGRRMTKREGRAIVKQITPQMQQARARFLDSGFHVVGNADLRQQADWVARRLLDPSLSWASISGVDTAELPSVIRSCHRFAKNAKLILPSRRLPPASRKLK